MIKVQINNICAKLVECESLTSGMIGKLVEVSFSSEWDSLNKIAVFSNGDVTKDLYESQWNGNYIPIPQEVLATPHRTISMGIYGYEIVNGEKVLAIPTIVAEIGKTKFGADPSNDPAADPTLPIWAQLQWEIDHFEIPDEQIATQVQAYLDEHPIEIQPATASILGGIKVGANLSITADGTLSAEGGGYEPPVGGIPKTDLASDVQASLEKADSALQTAPVTTVNGKTGAVNLVPADLGIGSVFNLKGSKPTYADLPAMGNAIGDVWYVVADSVGYIWLNDGTTDRWEQLGMEIDLSAYRTAAAQDIIDIGKVDKVTGKGLSTNDYTNADKAKVDSALTSDDTEEAETLQIDSVVTSGSTNLITSGAVYSVLGDIEAAINTIRGVS